MDKFDLVSEFEPSGDQPQAINEICANLKDNVEHQVLLGATGTGKTFIAFQLFNFLVFNQQNNIFQLLLFWDNVFCMATY